MFEIPVGGAGRLWLMPCPPAHDIGAVLDGLRERGVSVVLSLLPSAEADELGVGDEAALCAARGLTFLQFPIPDFGLPERTGWAALIAALSTRLADGEGIAIHCRAGIGRSGMAASCLLVALGDTADRAMARVAAARGADIPDTDAQAMFIKLFAN